MAHGKVKLPGYFIFGGSFLWIIALHSSESVIVLQSSIRRLLERMSFMNFA